MENNLQARQGAVMTKSPEEIAKDVWFRILDGIDGLEEGQVLAWQVNPEESIASAIREEREAMEKAEKLANEAISRENDTAYDLHLLRAERDRYKEISEQKAGAFAVFANNVMEKNDKLQATLRSVMAERDRLKFELEEMQDNFAMIRNLDTRYAKLEEELASLKLKQASDETLFKKHPWLKNQRFGEDFIAENEHLKAGIYRPDVKEIVRLTKEVLRLREALAQCVKELEEFCESSGPYFTHGMKLAKAALSETEGKKEKP